MKQKKAFGALVMASLLFFLTGCSGRNESVTRLVLDWTPNTNHTGFYVALENNYYKDMGITLEILQPPEDGALSLVASGNAEYAVSFQESLAPAIASANPLPVTAVAALVQHNTSGILSLRETNIQSGSDLCGKRFATWGTPLVEETIRQIVEADGGDFSEVEMIHDEATDAISALQTRIDAIWVYWGWDGVAAQLAGVECNYLSFVDCDQVFDFYSPILVAGNDYMASHSEEVKAFLKATAKGYEYAIKHPEEAARILLKHAPELGEELVIESQRYLSAQYKAEMSRWGEIDAARWSRFYDWMYEKELLANPLGSAGFTNDYLPR